MHSSNDRTVETWYLQPFKPTNLLAVVDDPPRLLYLLNTPTQLLLIIILIIGWLPKIKGLVSAAQNGPRIFFQKPQEPLEIHGETLVYLRCSHKLIHCRRWFGFGSSPSCATDPWGSPALGTVRRWMLMVLVYFLRETLPSMTNIAMENHHFRWKKSAIIDYKWSFAIVM